MKPRVFRLATLLLLGTAALAPARAIADEGMWLFNNPPVKLLKEKHNFDATPAWMEHLQRAAVRFNSGGSGSFVSADGLVMTNHHVGADALQKLGTKDRDLLKQGFFARTLQEEIKCLDLELNVLESIVDVTERVKAAAKPGMDAAAAHQARRAVMNTIEKESFDKTGLRSDVVTLYHGGRYHLYCYRKYTDVRLVFAPEQAIAFFGGDPDNFEYPRFDLDICFFRVYENDQPLKPAHYLRWSPGGVGDGELVFVAGNPGRTDRLDTVAHLEFLRDTVFPYTLDKIFRREVILSAYSERSLEHARRAKDELFGYQNSRKARMGVLAGLQDPAVMAQKRAAEKKIRDAVAADPKLASTAGKAWDDVAAAIRAWKPIYGRYDMLEGGRGISSELFHVARALVRMADETAKPNADRLREYRDSNLDSLKQQVFSEAPIYNDLEITQLADSLGNLLEMLGATDTLVQKILAGKSPRARAAELVQGTKLASVAARKALAAGGRAAITQSNDPMIALARLVDGPARELRKEYEEQVEEPLRQAYAKIAEARFALGGTDVYPDATFTLRLAFGVVRGYTEMGQAIPPWTTLGGTYRRAEEHANRDPFELPESWLKARSKLALDTPFNFVFTADIIGGNSGSPVVNRQGELVGIVFDGNLQSLVWDFAYTTDEGRAVAVDSRGIVEALRSVYGAARLVRELTGK